MIQRRNLIASGAVSASAMLLGCASGVVAPTSPAPAPASKTSGGVPSMRNPGRQRIAFGSCIDQKRPQPIWATVLAAQPDLFIFGGDNVYASQPPFALSNLVEAYAQLAANPGFSKLRQSVPHVAIWDDHDMGKNDAGADFPERQASKDVFLKFWDVDAADPRRARDGLHHAQITGAPGQRLQVILLDARWFRSAWKITDQRNGVGKERFMPTDAAETTMLGEAQWQWLDAQLRMPADVRLIVCGIQVVTNGHGWEGWAMFPRERERLYDLLATTRANGVVFLSGDRHIGALYLERAAGPYPLYEMTSSGITHAWVDAKEPGPNRLGDLVTVNHYGLIDIDWNLRRLSLLLQDEAGVTLRQQDIDFNRLRARREIM